jgi:ankyrin repeat protein
MEGYPLLPGEVPNNVNPQTTINIRPLNLKERPKRRPYDPLLQNTNENIQEINKEKQEFFDNCENGKLGLVKRSLGINPNLIYAKDEQNRTCLHYAVRGGKLDLVKYLIQKGADVNAININHKNSLHFAARYGTLEVFKYLVNKGLNINSQDINNVTPLHDAVFGIKIDVVSFLIENGANLNLKDVDGLTPYKLALYLKTLKTIPGLFKSNESLLNDLTIMLKEAMDKSPAQGGYRKSRSRRQRKRKSRTRKARR